MGGEKSHCISLICIFLCYYHYYVPFLFCPIKLSLSQTMGFTYFPIPSVISLRESELCGAELPARLNHNGTS